MVFYRKYRPQAIAELDSKKLRDTLYSVLSSDSSVPHAFLFTGPKGLGKTSTARIVAKAINCEERSKIKDQRSKPQIKIQKLENDIEPCNQCNQCMSITNGSNVDVLEIDGASNRGIDEIRDLREKIRLAPASAKKKVYIIDEVHMLTTEAFNALLKTLEEPPLHAVFILCTTEPHKVPETISSRCFHISFSLATHEELKQSFLRIAKGENITIDEEALENITSLADGSFRDGAKVLEEIALLASDKKITRDLVEQKYQISNIKYQISNMLGTLEEKNVKKSLELIAKLVEQGVDMKYVIEQLLNVLHEELLVKVGVENRNIKYQISNFKFQIGDIKRLVELLSKAHQEIKYAVLPQLPLELAVIEWSRDVSVKSEIKKISTLSGTSDKPIARSAEAQISTETSGITDFFHALIDKVKLQNQSIAGVLRGCTVQAYDGKTLIIETKYAFHKDRLNEVKTIELVEKSISEITGNNAKVLVVLK